MKKLITILCILTLSAITVYAQNEINDIDTEEMADTYFFESKIDNDWDLHINNSKIKNDNILISSENLYSDPYIQLRGFIENSNKDIKWDNNNSIEFDFNGDTYLISSSNEKGTVLNAPNFFKIRYVNIKNVNKDSYIHKKDGSIIFPLYIMNNTSYLEYLDFSLIANLSDSELKLNYVDKVVSLKKYNYTEKYIAENITKDMSYSQIIGVLGKSDYFEVKENCYIAKYNLGNKYIEMTFSDYTDDSDMKLIKAEVKDYSSDNIEKVIL
ncbi:MAG: hypothetical protein V8S74_08540 [Lachnospirales bacterium]